MAGQLRRRVEGLPLLWAALLAVAAVVGAEGRIAAAVACGVLSAVALCLCGRWRVIAAGAALAILGGALHFLRLGPQLEAMEAVVRAGHLGAEVTARVISAPQATGGGWSAQVEILPGGESPAGRVWFRGKGPAPGRGAWISAHGNFVPLPERRNPGEFDVAQWLFRQGVWAVYESRGVPQVVKEPGWFERVGDRARAWFRDAVTAGVDPLGREAAVIRAMVLGEIPDEDETLIDAFRLSGTLHVFSVSGMHVAMVGAIVWGLLRALQTPRRGAAVGILLAMLCYAWLTGMKPPATRAVMMAAVMLAAFQVRRRPDLLNALGAALVLAVLVSGHQVFQVGVQLSFGVVAAIGFGTSWVRRRLEFIERREPYLPLSLHGPWRGGWLAFRRRVASALGASSAAGAGSLPLTMWHFGFASWISVVASPLIGLPVFGLMTLALLAAALSPLPEAQQAVNRVNARVAGLCVRMAGGFASVPLGHAAIPRDRPGKSFLVVYDVGHGGGAACLKDGGTAVLFDTGHRPAFRRTVLPSLRHLALRPQSLVVSHPDGGHIGGALEALDALPVRQILLPVERARSESYRTTTAAAAARGIAQSRGVVGGKYDISRSSWLEVVHEPDPWNWHAVADERVMVTRLHWQGWRVLFVADAGLATERAMLRRGADLAADVIVAGRHRQDGSLGDDFLAATGVKAIVAGHADHPPEERVPSRWRESCEQRGITVFHQGESGAVTLVLEADGSLLLRGYVDGRELRLRR